MELERMRDVVLFRGDATTAYRDPAALFVDGVFHLFFTLVRPDARGRPLLVTAHSRSVDLEKWSTPRPLTPADARLNFSSPGNVIRHGDEWVMCLQTYPRPRGEKYGDATARLWSMRSHDLETWSEPIPLRVKGPDVPLADAGRMIDPFFVRDREDATKWWCLFKQNGVSRSWSRDLTTWHHVGHAEAGENVCVIVRDDEYVMLHAPANGIAIRRSPDLREWTDDGFVELDQAAWPWARGRLTAGFVLDLTGDPRVGKYLLFFHGSGPEDEETMFDTHASIGLAWSDDLHTWSWPGKRARTLQTR